MLFFPNPLVGANIEELGTRFPDMSHVYDPELCDKMCIRDRLVVLGDLAHEARGGLPVGQLLAQEGVEDGAGGVELSLIHISWAMPTCA